MGKAAVAEVKGKKGKPVQKPDPGARRETAARSARAALPLVPSANTSAQTALAAGGSEIVGLVALSESSTTSINLAASRGCLPRRRLADALR